MYTCFGQVYGAATIYFSPFPFIRRVVRDIYLFDNITRKEKICSRWLPQLLLLKNKQLYILQLKRSYVKKNPSNFFF